MLAPRLVKPLASVVGLPAAPLGGSPAGSPARTRVRNPGRTASTAAALMIGLALVTVVATLGAGLRGSTETAVKKQVNADYVVTAKDGGGSFPAASDRPSLSRRRRRSSPACARTPRKVAGDEVAVSGIDAKTIDHFYKLQVGRRARSPGSTTAARSSPRASPSARPQGRQPAQRAVLERREARSCTWSASTSRRRWTRCSATSRSPRRRSTARSPARRTRSRSWTAARRRRSPRPIGELSRTRSSRPRRSSSRAAPTA